MSMSEQFCAKCGLALRLEDIDDRPCIICGNTLFVPFREVSWKAALTPDDRLFLKINKIGST